MTAEGIGVVGGISVETTQQRSKYVEPSIYVDIYNIPRPRDTCKTELTCTVHNVDFLCALSPPYTGTGLLKVPVTYLPTNLSTCLSQKDTEHVHVHWIYIIPYHKSLATEDGCIARGWPVTYGTEVYFNIDINWILM